MSAAASTVNFGTNLDQPTTVDRGSNSVWQRSVKARPTSAALELGIGGEQRKSAPGAHIGAFSMLGLKRAGPGCFGPCATQHVKGGGCEQLLPRGIAAGDFKSLGARNLKRKE